MFTYSKNNRFQKKSIGQNTNQGRRENLRGPGKIFSGGSSNIGPDRSGFLRVRKGVEGGLINIHTNEGA
jgi:hypothetical protein